MKRCLLAGGLLLAALCCWSPGLAAQTDGGDRHVFATRLVLPNYILPLSDVPPNLESGNSFGIGLEFEYQRRLTGNFLLGLPLRISTADAIKNTTVNLRQPTNPRDVVELSTVGADFLLLFEPFARQPFFDPQFFAGIGIATERFKQGNLALPLGINLNLRFSEGASFSPQVAYRLALDGDEGDIRNNLQLGAGIHLSLGQRTPPPPPAPPADRDGDGTPDAADQCPDEPGPANLLGCPDTDGDGVADNNDDCPEVAGTPDLRGCPDADGDGITDAEDDCPEVAGLAAMMGCPDTDGDGITDAEDECPNEAGTLANNGCPVADRDGDGTPDAEDQCPDAAGTAANRGCPDTDGDGVVDPDDRCPEKAGPVDNRGCPEITEEDQETIDFAIQNINFETASANLTPASRTVLDRVVDILNRYPAYELAIGGHTDSIGSAESNQRLSEKRANSVLAYLTAAGIAADRMTARGFGESQPIGDNRYAPGRELNRRVTLDLRVD